MIRFVAIAFFLCFTCFGNAQIPDGAWNGKFWDKEKLTKQVEEKNPDALAEWAYCSKMSLLDIKYDPDKIFERAKTAADAGSAFGHYVLSRCYAEQLGCEYDEKKLHNHLEKAEELGHSIALAEYANLYFLATAYEGITEGVEPREKWGVKLLEMVEEQDCESYQMAMARAYLNGFGREKNRKKGLEILVATHRKYRSLLAAHFLTVFYHEAKRNSSDRDVITNEVMLEARARLDAALELGNQQARYFLAYLEVYFGNTNRAVPMMMECIKDGRPMAFYNASRWLDHGCRNSLENSYTVLGSCLASYELAAISYRLGRRSVNNNSRAVYFLMAPYEKSVPSRECMEVVDILRENIKYSRDHIRSHVALADFLLNAALEEKRGDEWFDRGIAHNVYMSHTSIGAHWVAGWYLYGKSGKYKDLVKGVAAAKWAISINSGRWEKFEQGWMRDAEKQLTEEQKKEVESLVKQGYPYADKFRKEAFKKLQGYGDIPETWEFESKKSRFESSSIGTNSLQKMARTGIPDYVLGLAYVSDRLENSEYSNELFGKYLSKQKIESDQEKQDLVRLLIEDDKRLESLLAAYEESHAERVSECRKIIKNETMPDQGKNAMGAVLGWYLLYENGELVSLPLMSKFKEDSLAKKCNLWEADAIFSFQGVSLKSGNARNLFKRLVNLWPEECAAELSVGRSRWGHRYISDSSPKDKMVKRKFVKPKS